jgi:hypothetical protein
MKKRLEALSRIGRLQALMNDIGRWRLSGLERQAATLNGDLKTVFEMLEVSEIGYGGHSRLVARHVRSLQQRLDEVAREQEEARLSALAQGRRAKLAEQAIETATLAYRRLNERKELLDMIEASIGNRGASPR